MSALTTRDLLQDYPLLLKYYDFFKANYPTASEMVFEKSDTPISEKVDSVNSLFISVPKCSFGNPSSISLTGIGLYGGSDVEFCAKTVEMVGLEEKPLEVIVLKRCTIKADQLKLQNVVFTFLNQVDLYVDVPAEKMTVDHLTIIVVDEKNRKKYMSCYESPEKALSFIKVQKLSWDMVHYTHTKNLLHKMGITPLFAK